MPMGGGGGGGIFIEKKKSINLMEIQFKIYAFSHIFYSCPVGHIGVFVGSILAPGP